MKGVVFNVVQEVVEEQLGADAWDDAIDRAGVDGAYTSLGSYPESDLDQLAVSVGEAAHLSRDEVLVFAGHHGFSHLAERHTDLVDAFAGWQDVVKHLDDIIHPEVEKIYPGADAPSFVILTSTDTALTMVYSSKRQLCPLAEGLLLGLGDWFQQPLDVVRTVRNAVLRAGGGRIVSSGGPSSHLVQVNFSGGTNRGFYVGQATTPFDLKTGGLTLWVVNKTDMSEPVWGRSARVGFRSLCDIPRFWPKGS